MLPRPMLCDTMVSEMNKDRTNEFAPSNMENSPSFIGPNNETGGEETRTSFENIEAIQSPSLDEKIGKNEQSDAHSDSQEESLESDSNAEDKSQDTEQKTDDSSNKTQETPESTSPPQREPVILPDPLPSYIKRVERPSVLKESLHCNVCDVYVNSENQMKQHVNSLRHKNISQGIPTPPKIGKEDKSKTRAEQFKCEICRVTLNSDIQLVQHLSSLRHKNMLEGKPPKPRWTPYERSQHSLLRLGAQKRLQNLTLPNPGPGMLLLPKMATIPGFPGLPVPPKQSAELPPPQASHVKQVSFLAQHGGLYQTQEIVYIGARGLGLQPTFQPQLHIPQPQLQIQPPLEYMLYPTRFPEQPSIGVDGSQSLSISTLAT